MAHAKFRNPRTTFQKHPRFPPKNCIVQGKGGSLKYFFGWNPNIFISTTINPTGLLSGFKSKGLRGRGKIKPLIVAT